MDVSRYARFERPGHRVTGDRSHGHSKWKSDTTRVGYDFAHAIVDDHSRLAYVEILDDARAGARAAQPRPARAIRSARGQRRPADTAL